MSVQIDGSTGNIIAIKADYSGDVSIGGTLTYEDVTNIDAVGLITARNGIKVDDLGVQVGTGATIDGATNTLTFLTNGSEKLRINSGGQISIRGTNTAFDTTGDLDSLQLYFETDSGQASIGPYSSGGSTHLSLYTNSGGSAATEKLRITSAGKIGVNNTSPLSDLQVITAGQTEDGTFRIGGSAASLGLVLDYDQSGATVAKITANPTYTNTSALLKICVDGDANADQLVLTGAGDVGIGDNAPNSNYGTNLSVHSTATDGARLKISDGSTGKGNTDGLDIISTGSVAYFINRENAHMSFSTNDTERLRIDSSGRVLLGTTTEGYSSGDDLTIATSGHTGITLRSGNTSEGAIYFSDNTSGAGEYVGSLVYSHNTNNMLFTTNGTERMRIDSSGNVNIGSNASTNPFTYLRFGASQHGAADIRPTDESSHKVGLAFYVDGTSDTTINPTERVRISSEGKVGIGHDTPQFGLTLAQTSNDSGKIGWEDSGSSKRASITCSTSTDALQFHTGTSDTERMRITSAGKINMGGTAHSGNNLVALRGNWGYGVGGGMLFYHDPSIPGGGRADVIYFSYQGTTVGEIDIDTNDTAYRTTSDYRLKENQVAIPDGIERVKQLSPYRFNWISTPAKTVDGFFAHEVQTVVPEAVSGSHNAVDDDNNPVYQGVDQAKLVPLLTAALQEAIAKIETLETKVAALEG